MTHPRTFLTTAVAVLLLAASAATSAAAADGDLVDWGAKQLTLADTGDLTIGFAPGDADFLAVHDAGAYVGALELSTYRDLPADHLLFTHGWQAWIDDLYDTVEADRHEACGADYRLDRLPVSAASFAGGEGVRYGHTGTWGDGRPSEHAIFHAVVVDDDLFILGGSAVADDSCLFRETEVPLETMGDLDGVLSRIAAASVLPEQGAPSVRRFAGPDRYGTARRSATGSFGSGASLAIVAAGHSPADALAASALAGRLIAPVLLTDRDHVPAELWGALGDLGAERVLVVGGTGAVSDAVVADLQASGREVQRAAGADRYETAAVLAGWEGVLPPPEGDERLAIVASGTSAADALAAGPIGYAAGAPILLTPGSTLGPDAAGALEQLGTTEVLVAGGTAAVSSAVADELAAMGIAVQRVAGADRTETAAAFATLSVERFGFQTHGVVLASGATFADALVAGVHGGSRIAPLLLATGPDDLGAAAAGWLLGHAGEVSTLHVVGGTAALSEQLVDAAVGAASAA